MLDTVVFVGRRWPSIHVESVRSLRDLSVSLESLTFCLNDNFMGVISSHILCCALKGLKFTLVNLKGLHLLCSRCLRPNTSCPVPQPTSWLTPLFDLAGV